MYEYVCVPYYYLLKCNCLIPLKKKLTEFLMHKYMYICMLKFKFI